MKNHDQVVEEQLQHDAWWKLHLLKEARQRFLSFGSLALRESIIAVVKDMDRDDWEPNTVREIGHQKQKMMWLGRLFFSVLFRHGKAELESESFKPFAFPGVEGLYEHFWTDMSSAVEEIKRRSTLTEQEAHLLEQQQQALFEREEVDHMMTVLPFWLSNYFRDPEGNNVGPLLEWPVE
ncbi:unnamed protein product, partial [Amoebophrya sp. A25]|eukprot:GSA25T00008599001.1